MSETKWATLFNNTTQDAYTVDGYRTLTVLAPISQGAGGGSRVGNAIEGKRLTMKFAVMATSGQFTNANIVRLRFLLLKPYLQTPILEYTFPDVFDLTVVSTTAFLSTINNRNFKVLKDKYITLGINGRAQLGQFPCSRMWKWSFPWRKKIKYRNGSGNIPNDQNDTCFLLWMSDVESGEVNINLRHVFRFSYKDIG